MACFNLPHYDCPFYVSSNQEILTGVWFHATNRVLVAVIAIDHWSCIDINSSQFPITQTSKAKGVSWTNYLHWKALNVQAGIVKLIGIKNRLFYSLDFLFFLNSALKWYSACCICIGDAFVKNDISWFANKCELGLCYPFHVDDWLFSLL